MTGNLFDKIRTNPKEHFMRQIKAFLFFTVLCSTANANNLAIANVSIPTQNTGSHYALIRFDVSWENSWRTSTNESNWDAAWLFIKFKKTNQTFWSHATINYVDGTATNDGHTEPSGTTIKTPSDKKGVFMYRNANGMGNVSWTGAQLRWNYGTDGVQDYDSVQICVFGIEMVYVPQGAFYAGDGSTTYKYATFMSGNTNTPLQITSEGALTLGGSAAGNLSNGGYNTYSSYQNGWSGDDDYNLTTTQTLPAWLPS